MIREWRMRFGKWPGQDVTPTAGVFQRGFEAGLAYARKEAALADVKKPPVGG